MYQVCSPKCKATESEAGHNMKGRFQNHPDSFSKLLRISKTVGVNAGLCPSFTKKIHDENIENMI